MLDIIVGRVKICEYFDDKKILLIFVVMYFNIYK